jgi:hypothetical protein
VIRVVIFSSRIFAEMAARGPSVVSTRAQI